MCAESCVPDKVAKVDHPMAQAKLAIDAGRYAELAVSLGASAASAIPASDVVVDDRVAFKCRIPKCWEYGICANCPPNSPSPDEMRHLVSQYEQAIAFKIDVAPEVLLRDRDDKERVGAYRKVFEIVGGIEAAAFYDGHYLSVGFGAGSCKTVLCGKQDCAVLKLEECRQPLKARPSMEASSLNAFLIAEKLGWAMYPIGRSMGPDCAGSGAVMGLILIG